MQNDLVERLEAALAFDAQNGTDAQWSELLAQAHNAAAEIRRLRGLVEELTERGVKVVIAYHVAIRSPEGIVPDDEFYDPIIAARVERSLESARATLSRLEPQIEGEGL